MKMKSVTGLIGVSIGLALSLGFNRWGDEILFETKNERQLEQIIGKEIRLNWTDYGEGRTEKVSRFEKAYSQARKNWDYFEKQFSLVKGVTIIPKSSPNVGYAASDGTMGFYAGPLAYKSGDEDDNTFYRRDNTIIHELAHIWHSSLPRRSEFEKRWKKITGSSYRGCPSKLSIDCHAYMKQVQEEVAATETWSAEDFREDVAYTVNLVYHLNKDHVRGKYIRESYERKFKSPALFFLRLEEKIKLLADYDFFSSQEKEKALQKLKKDGKTCIMKEIEEHRAKEGYNLVCDITEDGTIECWGGSVQSFLQVLKSML